MDGGIASCFLEGGDCIVRCYFQFFCVDGFSFFVILMESVVMCFEIFVERSGF